MSDTCSKDHPVVFYNNEKCPVCEIRTEKEVRLEELRDRLELLEKQFYMHVMIPI